MKCHLQISRRRPTSRAPTRGFTLIEIMIVVGIIGIVLAMGMPPFLQSFKKDPLRQAVSDVTEACSTARAQAILSGAPTELVMSGNELTVTSVPETDTSPTASGQDPAASLPRSQLFSAHLHEDVRPAPMVNLKNELEATEIRVHFYPNGTSDEFTVVLVYLQGGYREISISLECVTALANVEVKR